MTHETLVKFEFPGTLIHDYQHWAIVLRPKQATLGALVLIAKSDAAAFSDLPSAAYTELEQITKDIDKALRTAFSHDKINYLMLMMVDPQAHFHVLPRYENAQNFDGQTFEDPAWPGPPDLGYANDISQDTFKKLLEKLKGIWPN